MKIEDVYGYIGTGLESGQKEFTQKGIADLLGGSISSVHYALKPLVRIGSAIKKVKGFEVVDPKKFLVYWASIHKMRIGYSTHYPGSAEEIEGLMPPVFFTAYSGAKLYWGIEPTDYGEVYVYGDKEVAKRFPERKGVENVYCMQRPLFLEGRQKMEGRQKTPLTLLFVDLWNIGTWYAREFLREVEAKLDVLE
jgi:hypothetical protein